MSLTNFAPYKMFAALAILFAFHAPPALEDDWRAIATAAKGHVGVAALLIESGQSAALAGSTHFPMQSVYKLPITMAVLQQVDQGKLALDQSIEVRPAEYVSVGKRSPLRDQFPLGTHKTVRELITYTLVESDGSASDVLLRLAGGPPAVMRYLHSLGIADCIVANSEMAMDWKTQYDNWSTPEAAVKILVSLQQGHALSAASRTVVLDNLLKSQTGLHRIRDLLPAGAVVADKTGTSGTDQGITAATNDIALVTLPDGRHLALAVFVSDSPAPDQLRDQVIAKIARATWDAWARAH